MLDVYGNEIDVEKALIDNLKGINENTRTLIQVSSINRNVVGRIVPVTTTPTLIYLSVKPGAILVSNPSTSLGFSPAGSIIVDNTTISADGNTQGTLIGTANYNNMQMILKVTSITGSPIVDFYTQIQDPNTLEWVDTQLVFSEIGTLGTYYANIGSYGLGAKFAVRYKVLVPGTLTIGLSYILKDGLGGTSIGTSQTVYIGNAGVTTTSGYPLLENTEKVFTFNENSAIYGVAGTSVDVRVLEL